MLTDTKGLNVRKKEDEIGETVLCKCLNARVLSSIHSSGTFIGFITWTDNMLLPGGHYGLHED